MKKNIKRVLSLVLVFCMVLGLTVNVYATSDTGTETTAIETIEEETETSSVEETETTETASVEETEETEAEVAETEAVAEETIEEATEDDVENGISLASENDGIATVSDDTEDLSVTVYTNATATVSWDSTTQLVAGTDYTASGSIYATDDSTKVIATYTVTETVNSNYTYSLGSTTSSITSGGYYAIGTSGSYLAVDSDGNLTTNSTINASSVWIVTSSGSGYTIQNASTGAYLTYTTSGSGGSTTYSLAVSDDTYTWSWSSTYGFYFTTTQGGGPGGSTSYYRYINTSGGLSNTTSSSVSNKASLYTVTATAGGTTYTYTVTVTGVATGTGTLALTSGISIAVTVKVSKYTESGLNISYGWHVANIETFTSNSNTYVAAVAASTQAMATISGYDNIASGYITAQYNSASQGQSANYVSLGTVYGYDADVYYSGNTDGVYSLDDLNVTVYGSDETGTGTSGATLTMAQSTGEETTKTQTSTDGNGQTITFTISDYEEETIYDYNYITIVPENGYYVSNIVIGCAGSLEAAAGSPYAETSENIAFTNENGNDDLFGAYGVGCTSMSKGSLDTASYDPTTGTVVELNMSDWIESHAEDTGVGDPYFILIEIEKIPTPLYVEYEAGTGDGYIYDSEGNVITIVDSTDSYATATNNSVAFSFNTNELEAIDYLYTVLDPSVTSYTDSNGTTYYFTGWAVTYYTTASTDETNTYTDANGDILDSEDGSASYPYLSGTVALASDSISYGSGTTLYLFTHVKLVAQWTTVEPETIDYVVDFGLPVNLTLLDDLGSTLNESYTWSVLAVSSHPTYGTATVNSAANGVTYTLTEVMDGTDTMSVWLAGSQNGNVVSYAVVYVNIYPATTVYYEEGFATYGTGTSVTSGGSWTTTGSTGSTTQETHVANVENNSYNNYGYDGTYSDANVASNGTQAATTTATDSLSFSFTGTGVDIYANCTSSTGIVMIKISQNGSSIKMLTVDTSELGDYADTTSTSYNTPIASVTGLTHGTYDAVIYVTNLGTSAAFNFDGFRVYDTISQSNDESTGDYTVQTTVYKTDSEDYPDYTEIRDVVLKALIGNNYEDASSYTEDYVDSMSIEDAQVYASNNSGVAVYYSNDGYTGSWDDLVGLMDDGAKNELYLPAGVTLVLKLDSSALEGSNSRTIQIGVKSTSGTGIVKLGTESNATEKIVSTVDMFYTTSVDVTGTTDNESIYTVTIANTGTTTISLTKLKASDEVSISDEAITESEMTALLTGADDTEVEEETVFEPETFTVSTSVKTTGKSATVTVTAKTSTDVESIIVNGTEVTSYKTVTERSGKGKNATTTTYRQFTYTETVSESGTYTYEVAAVNADGVSSAAETATAKVTIRSTGNSKR